MHHIYTTQPEYTVNNGKLTGEYLSFGIAMDIRTDCPPSTYYRPFVNNQSAVQSVGEPGEGTCQFLATKDP